jgi:hypothetical protein
MVSQLRPPFLRSAIAALPLFAAAAGAQDNSKPETCINVSRVQRMEILDERTILFFLPGDVVYRNSLRDRCPNIDQTNNSVDYQITSSRLARLCANELLHTRQGNTCRLGSFEPITPEQASALLPRRRAAPAPVSSADVTPQATESHDDSKQGESPPSASSQQ